jgi:hypothetical protein
MTTMNAPLPPPIPATFYKRIPTASFDTYSPQQHDFHVYIDRAIRAMCASVSDSPQITRGRAQDVHQLIMGIGRYLNPVNKKIWLFKTQPVNVTDTLQKLKCLKTHFSKFCVLKISNVPAYQAHCMIMQEHMDAAVQYIQKKTFKGDLLCENKGYHVCLLR